MTCLLVWFQVLPGLDGQVVFFVVSSVFLLLLLRKPIIAKFNKGIPGKHLGDPSGQTLQVSKDIPPGGQGLVEYQGSPWEALSDERIAIPAGTKVKIVRQEGIKLWVKTFKEE